MTNLTIYPLSKDNSSISKAASENLSENAQGSTFSDILEMVNPLQHLPVISQLYRAQTGSDIPQVAKIIGGGLFGGVLGAASSAVVSMVESATGETLFESVTETISPDLELQPFSTAPTQSAVALTPDNGEAFWQLVNDEQVVASALSNNQPQAKPVETLISLRELRKSEIGLPKAGIEMQMRQKLNATVTDLI